MSSYVAPGASCNEQCFEPAHRTFSGQPVTPMCLCAQEATWDVTQYEPFTEPCK